MTIGKLFAWPMLAHRRPRVSPLQKPRDIRWTEMLMAIVATDPGLTTGEVARRLYASLCDERDYRQSKETVGFEVARLLRAAEADGDLARIDGGWWPGGDQ